MNNRGRPFGTTNAAKGVDDSISITMRIHEGDIKAIDEAAREMGVSRSALMRIAALKMIKESSSKAKK